MNESKLILMIDRYMEATPDNSLIMSILRDFKFKNDTILDLLEKTKEESRVIKILQENDNIAEII